MSRQEARRQQGAAAVFSEAEAVRCLPVREATAREWLRDRGLVQDVPGLGRVVVWADVLEAIRQGGGPREPETTRPPSRLPRAGLRR